MRTKKNKGFSLIELLIVVAIILIIAAIAIPNLLRARITANESSAVGSLRTLNTVLVQYATTYTSAPGAAPDCGMPPAMINLQPAGGANPTATSADLIDNVLAAGTKSGYTFTYQQTGTDANGCGTQYTINADPTTPGTTGQRYFFTDQSGVIRANATAVATINDQPVS
jgi:prepilin-type N-terminal cleavage/methylation domain-containing protein